MTLDGFIGTWKEEKKDGFENLANAIGLPNDKLEFYKNMRTQISYCREGDDWVINVGLVGKSNGRTFRFRLGESYQSADIDGSPMQSIITADGNKFVEKHKGGAIADLEMDITRWVDGDTMIVETSCKGLSMTSNYSRA